MSESPAESVGKPVSNALYAAATALAVTYPVVPLPTAGPVDRAAMARRWEQLWTYLADHEQSMTTPTQLTLA